MATKVINIRLKLGPKLQIWLRKNSLFKASSRQSINRLKVLWRSSHIWSLISYGASHLPIARIFYINKSAWSYKDDIIKVFQIRLNFFPNMVAIMLAERCWRIFFEVTWFYNYFKILQFISSLQFSLTLIGASLWLFQSNLMTRGLADRKLLHFFKARDLNIMTSSTSFRLLWTWLMSLTNPTVTSLATITLAEREL